MINVNSEINPLKEVLLHRPGKELLNLTPNNLERLLFDDIPFLKEAITEHDIFAQKLKENGVKVVYLEDLMAEVIKEKTIKSKFIKEYIIESDTKENEEKIYKYLINIKNEKKLILKTMEGITTKDLNIDKENNIIIDPMPNLYFTRDNFTSIKNGIIINSMKFKTRKRETIYAKYIFRYHPKYKNIKKYYDRNEKSHIEGGDILILNKHVIAIGLTERTEKQAIKKLAKNLFKEKVINTVIALKIPNKRTFMHLDTVLTQIDKDKFLYHPGIEEDLQIFEITEEKEKINIKEIKESLKDTLSKYLKQDITLIKCASGDKIASEREQWSDGSNTLCISPGVVIAYDRNIETNKELIKNGIKVIEIKSSELSRGRGGTRCMSMPLQREDD